MRKNAIQLLRTLLEYNPYGPSLSLREYHERFEEVKRQLEEFVVKRRAGQANDDEVCYINMCGVVVGVCVSW